MLGHLQLNCTQLKRLSWEAGGWLSFLPRAAFHRCFDLWNLGLGVGGPWVSAGGPRVIIIMGWYGPHPRAARRSRGCSRPMESRVRTVNSVPTGGARGWPLQLCPSQIIPCQSPPPRPPAHTQRRHRVTSDRRRGGRGGRGRGRGGGGGGWRPTWGSGLGPCPPPWSVSSGT